MASQPEFIRSGYRGSAKLRNIVAIVTGGDSGIGRAVAVHFAREGAKVVIAYLEEDKDARDTCDLIKAEGQPWHLFRGDLGEASLCQSLAKEAAAAYGRIDVLVNNGAEQHAVDTLEEITPERWEGAIFAFTRSIALALVERGIRANGVAPGPVWTLLIPATFLEDNVAKFGGQVPMSRAGQPSEIAPAYVFLASSDASYITGQVIHPNGGYVVNG